MVYFERHCISVSLTQHFISSVAKSPQVQDLCLSQASPSYLGICICHVSICYISLSFFFLLKYFYLGIFAELGFCWFLLSWAYVIGFVLLWWIMWLLSGYNLKENFQITKRCSHVILFSFIDFFFFFEFVIIISQLEEEWSSTQLRLFSLILKTSPFWKY